MNYTELIGWAGFIFIIFGYYLNAKKKINCFYIWGIGNMIYFIYGILTQTIPLAAMSTFLLGINLYGWFQWNKKLDNI